MKNIVLEQHIVINKLSTMVDNLLNYTVELHDIIFVDKNYSVIKRMINDYPEILNKLMPKIISNLTTNICDNPRLFKFIFGEL